MKTKDLQDLLEYFGREQACYTSLLDLSRQQREYIERSEIDPLLAVLGHKQQILARVSEIEEGLHPYKKNWPALRDSLSADDRGVVDAALATVEELLAELIALERECEELLVGKIELVRRDLGDATRSKGVHATYSAQPGPEGAVLDRKEA